MPMRKVCRSHAPAGVGEFAPVGALGQPYLWTRWHVSTGITMDYSHRLPQRRLPFCIRYGCMRIRPSVTLTLSRHYRHRRACRVRILGATQPCKCREEAWPGLQKAVYAGLVKPTPEERNSAHAFNRIALRSAWSYLSESHAIRTL